MLGFLVFAYWFPGMKRTISASALVNSDQEAAYPDLFTLFQAPVFHLPLPRLAQDSLLLLSMVQGLEGRYGSRSVGLDFLAPQLCFQVMTR
jgi:hypothetical protein